jgi:hypothetical protein
MSKVGTAPIIRSTIKTVDAIMGAVHVSAWFKSVERCPSSGLPNLDILDFTYDCIYSFNFTPDDGCRRHPKRVQ